MKCLDAFSVCLCMVKDTSNSYIITFSENVSFSINTTNCCGMLTPAASVEGGKAKGSLFAMAL